jgi:predicted RNA-binding protein with PUA-like domain
MNYFLAKTDPETYNIDDLARDNETNWDGLHGYQAVNCLKTWQVGDKVLVYHSMGKAAIVGMMEVVGLPIKDENDPRNISWHARVKFIKKFEEKDWITLKQVKESKEFENFYLVRQSRLSTMACPPKFILWCEKNGLDLGYRSSILS